MSDEVEDLCNTSSHLCVYVRRVPLDAFAASWLLDAALPALVSL